MTKYSVYTLINEVTGSGLRSEEYATGEEAWSAKNNFNSWIAQNYGGFKESNVYPSNVGPCQKCLQYGITWYPGGYLVCEECGDLQYP